MPGPSSHRPRRMLATAAVLCTLVLGVSAATAGASPDNNNSSSSTSTDELQATPATQTPNGSNGVNHNDPPPAADPDCTDTAGTSGTCSSPQPPSTADQNNTGANDTSSSNPYASTRNGAPSDNGSDNGSATGEPCAGCVGRADNKNPQGQSPNGPTDRNNGYECDGNNGIGQTNPAHTGCVSGEAQQSATTTNTGTAGTSGTQSMQSGSNSVAGSVLAETLTAPTVGGSGVAAYAETASPASPQSLAAPANALGGTVENNANVLATSLARTGSDLRVLGTLALVLLGAGGLFEAVARRRRPAFTQRPAHPATHAER